MSTKRNHHDNTQVDRNIEDPVQLAPSYVPTTQAKKSQRFLNGDEDRLLLH